MNMSTTQEVQQGQNGEDDEQAAKQKTGYRSSFLRQ